MEKDLNDMLTSPLSVVLFVIDFSILILHGRALAWLSPKKVVDTVITSVCGGYFYVQPAYRVR